MLKFGIQVVVGMVIVLATVFSIVIISLWPTV